MVHLNKEDSYKVFGDFIQQRHAGKTYFTGTVSYQVDTVEIMVTYQVFLERRLYYELEYIVVQNGTEIKERLETRRFALQFDRIMRGYHYDIYHYEDYEKAKSIRQKAKTAEVLL